jgi:hypothetical protein
MVKIDMQMPKGCYDCGLIGCASGFNYFYYCSLTGASVDGCSKYRHKKCPLIDDDDDLK